MKKTLSIVLALMLLLQSVFIDSYTAQAKTKVHTSGKYQYVILKDKTVRITNFKGKTPKSLKIPSKLGGKKVTVIGAGAFYNKKTLEKLTIPDTVKNIKQSAFSNCGNLKSIKLGKNITHIGGGAFCNTAFTLNKNNYTDGMLYSGKYLISAYSNLKGTVKVKEGTQLIAGETFNAAGEITKVILPKSLKYMGESVFWECYKLKSVNIPENVKAIPGSCFRDCSALENIELPGGIISIGQRAFSSTAVKEIKLPDNLKKLSYAVFANCSSLEKIEIPDTVEEIGDGAFRDCTGLKKLVIPPSVTSIGSYAFWECDSLTEMTIPNSVKSIGSNVFGGCSKLESVSLSKNIHRIPAGLFSYCSSLETVDFKGEIKSAGYGTFTYSKPYNDESNWENGAFYFENMLLDSNSETKGELKIKEGTTFISDYALISCKAEKIFIPESVRSIGESVFSQCYELSEFSVDESNANFKSENGILYNKDKSKLVCVPASIKNLTALTMPDSVITICPSACCGLQSIKTVTIGKNVKIIDNYAFYNAKELEKVRLNDKLKAVKNRAFFDCPKLKSVTVPKNVKEIGEEAFGVLLNEEEGEPYLNEGFELKGYSNTAAQKYTMRYVGYDFDYYGYITFVNLDIKAPKVKIKTGKNKMKISYSSVKGVSGYQIRYTTDGITKTSYIKNSKANSKLIKKLKKGKYKVQVRAYKERAANKEKVYTYGRWSKEKTVKI